MAERVYFVERLSLRAALFAVLPRLLEDRRAGRPAAKLWVIDATAPMLALFRGLGALLGTAVEKLVFRLTEVRDEQGRLVRLRLTFDDMNSFQREILQGSAWDKWLAPLPGRARLPGYLAKGLATMDAKDPDGMWRRLFMIEVCAWKTGANKAGAPEVFFFLSRLPWFDDLARYARRRGVSLLPSPPPLRGKAMLRSWLSPDAIELQRHLRQRGLGGALRLVRLWSSSEGAIAGEGAARPAKLAVDYYGQLNLDRPELHSDIFFWQQSKISAGEILVCFRVLRSPLDADRLEEIRRLGMSAVALDPGAADPEAPLFYPRRIPKPPPPPDAGSPAGPETDWLRERARDYEALRAYWLDFFTRNAVRVYASWYKIGGEHHAIADALEEAGGVSAFYQRSFEAHPDPEATLETDVNFCFSPKTAEVYRADNSNIRYNVAVGYIGDHRFPLLRESALKLRAQLQENGARFIVALFDENSIRDARWQMGHENQRAIYGFLLEKLLSEPWLGLVAKPKVPRTLRIRLGPVAELLDRAEKTGRCHVFKGDGMLGAQVPAAAALAADVAVHGWLHSGTAALEAALAGVPSLMLDLVGWPVSPLYRLGVGKVVFNDWESLWEALLAHRNRSGGIPGFGEWKPLLDELAPFRDGLAAHRMGSYLQWLLEGFREGHDRERCMARAAERYAKIWGADKITEIRRKSWR